MAWQYPSSTETENSIAVDLGTTDSVFIAEDVLIFADAAFAVQGMGNNHVVEISGEVQSGYGAIAMGGSGQPETSGNAVFVDSTGVVECSVAGGTGIAFYGNGNLLVNDGTITAGFAGVYIRSDVMSANRIVNNGTISGEYGILGDVGLAERILWNSGRIEGSTASYGYQPALAMQNTIDIVHNRGTMAGSVFLDGNDDQFFGAKGRMIGTLDGGYGNDELYVGAGNNTVIGGDGNDTIAGGAGADRITGGDGTDTVIYYKVSDSTFKNPDFLTDITTDNLDTIDLRLVDANAKKSGDQGFSFDKDPHEIGSLWLDMREEKQIVWIYGETDGDKQIDFAIKWSTYQYHGGEILV